VTLHNQLMQCRVSIYQKMGIKEVVLHSFFSWLTTRAYSRLFQSLEELDFPNLGTRSQSLGYGPKDEAHLEGRKCPILWSPTAF
jgi:hypothetical protein